MEKITASNTKNLEKSLNIAFNNKKLLRLALTHRSCCNINQQIKSNERLEFFGDAVLKLLVSEYLYKKYPDFSEGELSKIRAQAVSDKNLAEIGQKIGIGEYIYFSRGENNSGGRTKASNLANAFEALLGAYFIDSGLNKTREFMQCVIKKYNKNFSAKKITIDFKSKLQELLQQQKIDLPEYNIVKEEGPAHKKVFHIRLNIKIMGHNINAMAKGLSKKNAEQLTANKALKLIQEKLPALSSPGN